MGRLEWLASSPFSCDDKAQLSPTSKPAVVNTFESIGKLCGQPIRTETGLRAFGGHSARVTGTQTFAALGIEINKVRLMARHSGEAIMRYVAEALLRSLRADMGFIDPDATAPVFAS